jgi:predicted acylesterase/phospholipase RssA
MSLLLPIPSYASNKYRNTRELLEHSEGLVSALTSGQLTLNKFEERRVKKFRSSLLLKEQMLGYLEDLTDGEVHREQISKDDLRMYTDWLLSDTPEHTFPTQKKHRAFSRAQWLRGFIENADDPDAAKREVLRSLYLESRPEIKLNKIQNLVLAGGGAKALSLSGAIKSLEDRGYQSQIKRVAGTSGGAIIAMAFAAGYSAKELHEIVMQNEFGLFTLGSNLDTSVLNQWAHHFSRDDPQSKLHVLSDNTLAHHYHNGLMQAIGEAIIESDDTRLTNFKSAIQGSTEGLGERLSILLSKQVNHDVLYHSLINVFDIDEQFNIDNKAKKHAVGKVGSEELIGAVNLYKDPSTAMVNAMRHKTGHDIILGFFSDLVYDKLKTLPQEVLREAFHGLEAKHDNRKLIKQEDIRNITFKQWQELHKIIPNTVKELHISMSILRPVKSRLSGGKYDPYDHQDAAYDNPEFGDMRVTDAVRVSMNLPPIYPRFDFEVNGRQYKGSDGGLKSNMSLATFDSKYPPEYTIGVFYKTKKELEIGRDVDRMLVIPRSKKEVEREMLLLDTLDKTTKEKLVQLRPQFDVLPKDASVDTSTERLTRQDFLAFVDERRRYGGELAHVRREYDTIVSAEGGGLTKWLTNPIGQFGHLLGQYLNEKSDDDLSGSHNLRRLVMINTQDIDTAHFKMPQEDKVMQMRYGEQAMNSLLNGTYCLENHFYYHHYRSIMESTLEHNLNVVFGEPENDAPTPHGYEPEGPTVLHQENSRGHPKRGS